VGLHEANGNGNGNRNGNGNGGAGHGAIGDRRRIKRVLVVGGAGYVGSVLVRRLLERGNLVTVMDALMYGDDGIRDLADHPLFDVVRGDLRDLEVVVAACRDADAVVHLGALVGDPACALDEDLTLDINLTATQTLAAVARGMGIERFIFASTCGVYGASDGLLNEESALDPVSLYSRTKMDSERYLLSLNGSSFHPVVMRFGTFYGASPRARFDLVVNLLVAKAVTEGEITILGGSQWRPFVHVEDGAEAILKLLEAPAHVVSHRIFNVGSDDQNHTLAQIADLVAAAVPGTRVRFEAGASDEANYRVSFASIRDAIGFEATRTLADGVAEIKAAIERGAVTDYADARYSNYKSLMLGDSARVLESSGSLTAATSGAS
jgi:nucleoside-diphosphate-sugar epimerase